MFIFFSITLISATPQITIHSPQNITYDTTKIPINVTANEPVTFFLKDLKNGKNRILAENTTNLEDFIYAKTGSYTFTIWANNSNEEANESVVFSDSESNPINITSCGYLYSSDTKYVLSNNIAASGRDCITISYLRNISLDLNDNAVTSGTYRAINMYYSSDVEIFNGPFLQ
jgi:hypothetical protein